MNRNVSRLLLSLTLSVAGATGVHLWYSRYEDRFAAAESLTGTPVAEVRESGPGVMRKPKRRLVWYPLQTADAVRAGEELRTPDQASAELLFVASGARVEIEPGSLITIEQNETGPQLELLEGQIFVDPETAAPSEGVSNSVAGGLTIKADGQVLKPTAEARSIVRPKTGPVRIVPSVTSSVKRLRVVSPADRADVFLDFSRGETLKIDLKDEPPKAVTLLAGEHRSRLRPVKDAVVRGRTIVTPATRGVRYFQVVGENPSGIRDTTENAPRSEVFRIQVREKAPPVVLSPLPGAGVTATNEDVKVDFAWTLPAGLKSPVLEVATTRDLKQDRQTLSPKRNRGEFTLKPGRYFWRVTAYLPDRTAMASPVREFHVLRAPTPAPSADLADVPAPPTVGDGVTGESESLSESSTPAGSAAEPTTLESAESEAAPEPAPLTAPQFAEGVADVPLRADRRGDVQIQWAPVVGADQYLVRIQDQRGVVAEQKTRDPVAEFRRLPPGRFQARIRALRGPAEEGPTSPTLDIWVPKVSDAKAPKLKGIEVLEESSPAETGAVVPE